MQKTLFNLPDTSSIVTIILVAGYVPLIYLQILPADSYKEILLFVLGSFLGAKKKNQNQNTQPKEEPKV